MASILDEVHRNIPKTAEISDSVFEGANIVLYTKNKYFFFNSNEIIKDIVDSIKKRVELRPDPSLTMDMEEAEKKIKKIIPEEANISNVIFDTQRSIVIIEAEKPGLAIGKQGDILREIRKETLWIPFIRRTPAIRSKLIENIRQVLYENSDFRRKFLHQVGKRIYDGWKRGKKDEWVRISILGGGRQVGRSCFLLQTQESRVLLDCGINPSKTLSDHDAFPHLDAPEFNLSELDAIVLSHSHIDHCSTIPYLYKMGYTGPVYCTEPTRDLAALLCLDMISISTKEGQDPLYTSTDVKNFVNHTITLDYEEVTDITPDVRITLYNAGHHLGSSLVHMHIGNGLHNFVYTGDFNYETSNLLASAITRFPRLETVMMESTYGSREDLLPSRREAEERLFHIINETVKRNGKILLPVLGVGRSQEVMVILEMAMRQGLIPKIPIYLQGMLWDVTAIHTAYPDFFNARVKRSIFHKDTNPFLSDVFKRIVSKKEQQEVIDSGESCIIMATSGMMVGGASVEYFKQLAENPKHTLVFTCYQPEGSLGRRLLNGDKEINFGSNEKPDMVYAKLDVFKLDGISEHSSRKQLMTFVKHLDPKPRKIILVHGEASKCIDLASSIHKFFRIETVTPR